VSGDSIGDSGSLIDDLSGNLIFDQPLAKVVGKILDEVLRLSHPVGIREEMDNDGVDGQRRDGRRCQRRGREGSYKQNEKRSETLHSQAHPHHLMNN
jgi:hypothetical protein